MVIINDKIRVKRGWKIPDLQLLALLCGDAEAQVNSDVLLPVQLLLAILSSSRATWYTGSRDISSVFSLSSLVWSTSVFGRTLILAAWSSQASCCF